MQADVLIGRALELGQVFGDGVVDIIDPALLDRSADQDRGQRLGDGEGGPAVFRLAAEGVFLQHDLAILDDQHAADAVVGHVLVDGVGAARVRDLRIDLRRGDGQGTDVRPLGDGANLVGLFDRRITLKLLLLRPCEDGGDGIRPDRLLRQGGRCCEQERACGGSEFRCPEDHEASSRFIGREERRGRSERQG